MAGAQDANHDFGACPPLGDKFWYERGWVLQVGIETDGCCAASSMKTGGRSNFFAEVSRKFYHPHAAVLPSQVVQLFYCVVGTPIINKDKFENGARSG